MSMEDDCLIEQYFQIFDYDNDGNISKGELKNLFKVIFKTWPTEDGKINEMLQKYDSDANGKLELSEFKKLYHSLGIKPKGDSLKEMFSKYDKNNDGDLSMDEVRTFLQDVHDKNVSDKVVTDFMMGTDVDNDGRVNFNEFVRMFVTCFADGAVGKEG